MAETLSVLLSNSWKFYIKNIVAIAIGAIVIGVIAAVIQMALGSTVKGTMNNALNTLGIDANQMEQLRQRAATGDQEALQQLQQEAQNAANAFGQKTAGEVVANVGAKVGGMATGILISTLILFLLGVFYNAYLLLLTLEGRPVGMTMTRAGALYVPFVGLTLWMLLCSLVWIPIVGPIIGIFTLPRLLPSSVIFVKDKAGVFGSVKQSFAKTSGYWGKIIGNMIVVAVLMIIAFIVVGIIANLLGPLSTYVMQVLQQFIIAFMAVFMVKLSLTVLAHPKAA
jgi:hypothetical protein